MAYGRRKYTKRAGRRGRLTTARIYGNRSARAQSYQIAKINRTLHTYMKRNRPEIRVMFRTVDKTFTNNMFSNNFDYFTLQPWQGSYNGGNDDVAGDELQGNYCRCKGLTFKGVFEYGDNSESESVSASHYHDKSAGFRVVLAQRRDTSPIVGTDPAVSVQDVFQVSTSVTSSDTNLVVPLASGITAEYKILTSRTYTVSKYHPIKQVRIKIPESRCIGFTKAKSLGSSTTNPRGQFFVFILTCGLHYDTDYASAIAFHGMLKIAFTDN
ncbi:capsid protein [Dipodfec virus UA23Rod_5718]|uniref:Capsid protein n=1 Tax=Dipodfec virus UA23Rod_5718 TaxID=2929256 RepID=A0A976R5F1_9VIRU|nr:capsid protein [Dipodfec virus UA23Rod_5718]